MLTGLFLTLLALVGIIAIMVWIVQLPFVALLINIGLIALAAWILKGPFVALLAIIGFVAIILSALRWAKGLDRRQNRRWIVKKTAFRSPANYCFGTHTACMRPNPPDCIP